MKLAYWQLANCWQVKVFVQGKQGFDLKQRLEKVKLNGKKREVWFDYQSQKTWTYKQIMEAYKGKFVRIEGLTLFIFAN